METPYLSVIVATRDDSHGGDPFKRLSTCLKIFSHQAEKYSLPIEYIVVDWNSPADSEGLFNKLKKIRIPGTRLDLRVIEVPRSVHQELDDAKIPFYQMIAKNVGIVRSRGEFVLSTNIDIFLYEKLFETIAKKNLRNDRLYRSNRFDIENCVYDFSTSEQHLVDKLTRLNFRGKTVPIKQIKLRKPLPHIPKKFHSLLEIVNFFGLSSEISLSGKFKEKARILKKKIGFYGSRGFPLHTNGAGDFLLLSRKGWDSLRGFPEWRIFSMHIDSIFCFLAQEAGYLENCFSRDLVHFHIDHGDGWSPESDSALFGRLIQANVPFISNDELICIEEKVRKTKHQTINPANWGLQSHEFKIRRPWHE
ncbi:hypothetical protein EBX31_09820 [bacterium]|nr:hypothetical protein [bacterium]